MTLASVLIRANGADGGNSWAEDDLFTENQKRVLQTKSDSLNEEFGSWESRELSADGALQTSEQPDNN
jgi:hypothetical protein